jgi:hypothetical protein
MAKAQLAMILYFISGRSKIASNPLCIPWYLHKQALVLLHVTLLRIMYWKSVLKGFATPHP